MCEGVVYAASLAIFCLLVILLWVLCWIAWLLYARHAQTAPTTPIQDIESAQQPGSGPARANVALQIAATRGRRTLWRETLMYFAPKAEISRLAVRALPPAAPFQEDEASTQSECPICLEDFINQELVQPFGVCLHLFHAPCINSWLLQANTTCPVCRKELTINP
ncbi:unnamed protein product [Sphenostylis stenocarpa]|uniref:RING-type domain-containing protein n=1 Tax=Sphenostylis stenocarpa TaxID=92480 RepID=A0AA86TDA6_9FABA|nr:unnamed protein product [Sphenostylis stenocarpa]